MLHTIHKWHSPTASVFLGCALFSCSLCWSGQSPRLVGETPDIHEQAQAMEQEPPSRWWNKKRTAAARTANNPPLLAETLVPEPAMSEPYTLTPEQRRAEQASAAPEIRADQWVRSEIATKGDAVTPAPVESAPETVRSEKEDAIIVTNIPSYALPAAPVQEYEEYEENHQSMSLPTPEGVEKYRLKLEDRLLERYNNLPEYAGRVALVRVVLSRPLDVSLDGKLIRAEFDQLAYDNWGNRMPDLEKEYYVVTFGSGGVKQVRSDPSIRIGLDMEKTYSEKAPLVSDPFRNVETQEAFRPAPQVKMPSWWRPEFPELD